MTAPKRIQLRRTKGWRKPESAIVVARPSRWGNPFRLDDYRYDYPDVADDAPVRRMAVSDFQGMIDGKWGRPDGSDVTLGDFPSVDEIRKALAGHDLACWCPLDQPCHADVLLELANQ